MDVSHLFLDTVTIAAQASVSEAGDPTFGSQSTIKARVEHGTKLVVSDGAQIQADHVVITTSPVLHTDRLWLPGDSTSDNNAARRPVVIKKATGLLGGLTLYEVYL